MASAEDELENLSLKRSQKDSTVVVSDESDEPGHAVDDAQASDIDSRSQEEALKLYSSEISRSNSGVNELALSKASEEEKTESNESNDEAGPF